MEQLKLTLTDSNRFWSNVTFSPYCWVWEGQLNKFGYGTFSLEGKKVFSHRLAFGMLVGNIPKGLEVDHRCHTRHCINPQHLRLVTRKQNNENLAGLRKDNSSGVRGVSWVEPNGKWRVRVKHNGRAIHVGYFDSLEEAERVSVAKRLEIFTHSDMERRHLANM